MVWGESLGEKEWFAVVEWFGEPEIETDEAREHRITMEAVVDAYNEQERSIGWYYYLEGRLDFPFLARCAIRRSTSPLKVGEEVEVIGMAPVEECEHDMFVEMDWDDEGLAIPLSQLEVVDADDETREAVEGRRARLIRFLGALRSPGSTLDQPPSSTKVAAVM
jgi:hypothetical protein